MRDYYTTSVRPSLGFGRPWTPAVRALILACTGAFVLQTLLPRGTGDILVALFGMDSSRPWEVWRWFTSLFLHGNVFHLLFNMFALWVFGSDLEERMGRGRFVAYYLFTGAGAALCVILVDALRGRPSLVVGASGAIFGLLAAYGVYFAERVITVLLFFVLPVSMRARTFVAVYGALELLFGIGGSDRVAHFAHLGGLLFGLAWLAPWRGARAAPLFGARAGGVGPSSLRARWERWARVRDERRLDDLLNKVNERGIGALSEGEKRFLHRMSRRARWH